MLWKTFFVSLSVVLAVVSSTENIIITSELGMNVTLPCSSESNQTVLTVQWRRPGIGHLAFYKYGNVETHNLPTDFQQRAKLLHSQMTDASLVLNNVQVNDTGLYVCRVFYHDTKRWSDVTYIQLKTVAPEEEELAVEVDEEIEKTKAKIPLRPDYEDKRGTRLHFGLIVGLVMCGGMWMIGIVWILAKKMKISVFPRVVGV